MLYRVTVLLLILGLSCVSCVSEVSPCTLSVRSQCGLMALGLRDVCDCLRSDAVCSDKHLKGVTPSEVRKALKPLCKDPAKFLEDCTQEMPCGAAKAVTSKQTTATTKIPTISTTTKRTTMRPTTKTSSKPSTTRKEYSTLKQRSTTRAKSGRDSKDMERKSKGDDLYSKIKDYMKNLDE